MTLGELESVGQRMHKAAADIRAAQALFSGSNQMSVSTKPSQPEIINGDEAAAAHRRRQFQAVEVSTPRALQTDPRATLSAAEVAERQRLLGRNAVDKSLPEDMQALESQ